MLARLALAAVLLAVSSRPPAQDAPPPKKTDPPDAGAPKGGRKDAKGKKDKKAGGDEAPAPALSIDEEYVREKLEGFLHPTKVAFSEGGRVKLHFDLSAQDPKHAASFSPKVSPGVESNFRWSRGAERAGLRIANGGAALLNCWFEDDVEAEISHVPGTNYSHAQTTALVLVGEKDASLGSNFGTECVVYSRGVAVERRSGEGPRPAASRQPAKIKLVVRGGSFEAHADGKKQAEMRYGRSQVPSGRIGFLWGGGVAGIITRFEIEGKLDLERMVREIRKAR
ncbi:MAG: hypothetical protein HY721_35015 [Planctomycetes bacterium]|nr:hypothetical protein [Planctomycetota bacterium]